MNLTIKSSPDAVPRRLFVFTLFFTLAILSVIAWQSWHAYKNFVTVETKYLRLQQLIDGIIHNDKKLTLVARMAATTGDPVWEQRYLETLPKLEAAIKETVTIHPDKECVEAFAQTDAANTRLVEMERQSFGLVHSGRLRQALAIIDSEEYQQQKRVYREGIAKAAAHLQQSIQSAVHSDHQRALLAFILIILSLPVTILAWHHVLKTMSRHETERIEAAAELRRLSEAVGDLYNNAPCGYHSVDGSGLFVQINETELAWLGYSRDEIIGKMRISDIMTPASVEVFKKEFPLFKDRGFVNDLEFEVVRKNGSIIDVLLNSTAINDSEGRFVMSRSTIFDITNRKRAQDKIRQNEMFLQAIIDSIDDPIMVIAPDYSVMLSNQRAHDKSKHPGQRQCHQISHHSDSPCEDSQHPCPLNGVLNSKAPVKVTHRHFDGDGEPRFHEIAASPLFGPDGAIIGVIESSRDITDHIKAEDAIRQSLKEKEMLVREVHHRVKNNLAVIQSLLNLQSRQIRDEESRKYFTESQNRIKSMSMIHERLYRAVDLKSVDFAEYIRSLVTQLFHGYKVNAEKVRLTIDVTEMAIDIDTMIPCGLIVNELVSNALKYAFPGGRSGTLIVSLKPGGAGECLITVKDDGIGMPADIDIYNTASLGMQLVTSLTAQIGGTLEFIQDAGTEFRIRFREKPF